MLARIDTRVFGSEDDTYGVIHDPVDTSCRISKKGSLIMQWMAYVWPGSKAGYASVSKRSTLNLAIRNSPRRDHADRAES